MAQFALLIAHASYLREEEGRWNACHAEVVSQDGLNTNNSDYFSTCVLLLNAFLPRRYCSMQIISAEFVK